eukprot:774861-Pleurochrysis_carterae.AAC.1
MRAHKQHSRAQLRANMQTPPKKYALEIAMTRARARPPSHACGSAASQLVMLLPSANLVIPRLQLKRIPTLG